MAYPVLSSDPCANSLVCIGLENHNMHYKTFPIKKSWVLLRQFACAAKNLKEIRRYLFSTAEQLQFMNDI